MNHFKFKVYDKEEKKMMEWEQLKESCSSLKYILSGERFVKIPFTGFKDKNGKDIYFGDKLKSDSEILFVELHCDTKKPYVVNGKGLPYSIHAIQDRFVVVGNIFEEDVVGMDKLVNQVEEWSKNKGLDKAESSKQYLKVAEEVGEVAAALARNDKDALKDGIGDVVVTLVILAQQNDLTIEECLQCAYDEIKGRTGKMVDGVFVKSEDLK